MVLGDESAAQTARRFDSREHPTEAQRPLLRVYYTQATAVEAPAVPTGIRLLPAYPNPFREATTIVYEVGEPGHVTLEVFDVLGRRVARLVDGPRAPGRHRAMFVAPDRAGGLYVYRLQIGDAVALGRVARIR
ncbi:MAG: T9SS C-terminal target domain-containing protein [Bacteroidetes bacterium]|nr:MAG: T9SS C-terminal target domain-containing protein [Bacteroidota bacterium]